MRALLTAGALLCGTTGLSWADGRCDLNSVVGYQIIFGKPIQAYIQDGKRKSGYLGCEPDRVLVFADNTGVRCKELALQKTEALPIGYLLGRNAGDLKLCVDGQLFEVSSTN